MRGRIIINPEAIDRLITRRSLALSHGLVLPVLRRVLRNEKRLFSRVCAMPDNAPPWLTVEMIAAGNVYQLDMTRAEAAPDIVDKQRQVEVWLIESARHLPYQTARDQRKWHTRLRHIRSLDEAVALAHRDIQVWFRRRRRRRSVSRQVSGHPDFPPLPAKLEAAGEMMRTLACADGRVWFELISDMAKWHEGVLMEHCLRGAHRLELIRQGARVFSLRGDARDGQVTLSVWPNGRWQAVRRSNGPVRDEDRRPIDQLLAHLGWDGRGELTPELAQMLALLRDLLLIQQRRLYASTRRLAAWQRIGSSRRWHDAGR